MSRYFPVGLDDIEAFRLKRSFHRTCKSGNSYREMLGCRLPQLPNIRYMFFRHNQRVAERRGVEREEGNRMLVAVYLACVRVA